DRAPQHGQDALVVLECVLHLESAHLRRRRLRRDHVDEAVGTLDGAEDLAHPLGRRRNALLVHPGGEPVRREGIDEAVDEVGVAARVGDEDVAHARKRSSTLRVMRSTKGLRAARPYAHSVVPALKTSPAPRVNDAMTAWPRSRRRRISGESAPAYARARTSHASGGTTREACACWGSPRGAGAVAMIASRGGTPRRGTACGSPSSPNVSGQPSFS